jgi:hypothetical protein
LPESLLLPGSDQARMPIAKPVAAFIRPPRRHIANELLSYQIASPVNISKTMHLVYLSR